MDGTSTEEEGSKWRRSERGVGCFASGARETSSVDSRLCRCPLATAVPPSADGSSGRLAAGQQFRLSTTIPFAPQQYVFWCLDFWHFFNFTQLLPCTFL